MQLESLALRTFRSYGTADLRFGPGLNFFLGENGQGKTNLLEAIYCLGLVRSFRTSGDADLVQIGQDGFEVHGRFVNELGVRHQVSLVHRNKKKQYF